MLAVENIILGAVSSSMAGEYTHIEDRMASDSSQSTNRRQRMGETERVSLLSHPLPPSHGTLRGGKPHALESDKAQGREGWYGAHGRSGRRGSSHTTHMGRPKPNSTHTRQEPTARRLMVTWQRLGKLETHAM